ncbi:MAG: tyrosine--tRNA ligase [Candidatus Omnitrophica bacterium]|nr:tyrosine--tRNA ligase [Candidatus Omnitrophota bacterium]MBU1047709.1 tyrosine--tRNA ligase [Candidatus Omnitrophota bacterium]MBU1630429.1 tyrosine--tRNA ligase [Candidatus Omnitrophota bacterium]MBU1888561.1 tyrosine--tRNA ligase [Candidatus Omnitrophota bacterium]
MNIKKQFETIKKNTEEVIPEDELLRKLEKSSKTKTPLRIKWGADPSAPDIHLGHTVVLRKLRQFQDLGHIVIFIIGDFTARIGDPSGKDTTRPKLSVEEIKKNSTTYKEQVFKILDKQKTEVVYNSAWLENMKFDGLMQLFSFQSVSQTLQRNEFKKRMENGKDIRMLEFIYPLIQGYDSVVLKADVEIGATEQKFNLLMGRTLQKKYGQEPQVVITMPILEGLDGKQKMSKSLGNYVGVSEMPENIYGKIMSIPDELILRYFKLLTFLKSEDIKDIEISLKKENPKQIKEKLACTIVQDLYNKKHAEEAKTTFDAKHTPGKSLDDRIKHIKPEVKKISPSQLKEGKIWICSLLTTIKATASNSDARRLVEQGAVYIDNEKITDHKSEIALSKSKNTLITVGKRKYYETTLTE